MKRACLILALSLGACLKTSPPLDRDRLAMSPYGVTGTVRTPNMVYSGELLAVTPEDLTLLTDRRVVVIPYRVVVTGDFRRIDVVIHGQPSGRHFDQLRYASRFPYGIPASALAQILSTVNATAPDSVKAP